MENLKCSCGEYREIVEKTYALKEYSRCFSVSETVPYVRLSVGNYHVTKNIETLRKTKIFLVCENKKCAEFDKEILAQRILKPAELCELISMQSLAYCDL
jgi:hypothetical protein